MNDQQRAAMQMALDALTEELSASNEEELEAAADLCNEAITALREALRNASERMAQPFDLEAAVKADIDQDLKELRREMDGEFLRMMENPQDMNDGFRKVSPYHGFLGQPKTPEQLQEIINSAIEATKEKAAKKLEAMYQECMSPWLIEAAAAIRSMK